MPTARTLSVTLSALAIGLGGSLNGATTTPVSVSFALTAGTSPVGCGQPIPGLGTTKSTATLTDFRLYVSNPRLLDAGGQEVPLALTADGIWQHGTVALLDFENKTGDCANGTTETRTVLTGEAPTGTYAGFRFDLGLPFDVNHRDPTQQPSPLNLTRLFWNWNAGYKFARLDMRTTGQPRGWVIHLGSTGCTPNAGPNSVPVSCAHQNLATITLPSFHASRDAVVLDLAALLQDANIDINQPETAAGCMSAQTDSDCRGLFAALGLPFSDEQAGAQRVFRAVEQSTLPSDRR